MYLTLTPTHLQLHLSSSERFWAFHLGETIAVPLSHITQASTIEPLTTWRELRAPGAYLPGVIKAGTYYTERGREFWYVTDRQTVLCLDVRDDYYKRIVLTLPDYQAWYMALSEAIAIAPTSDSP